MLSHYTIAFVASSDQAYYDKKPFRMNFVQLADTFFHVSDFFFFLNAGWKKAEWE